MPKFDVYDEAIIEVPPMTVFNVILDELSGVTRFIPRL
jgi:hypothetical protein